MSPAASTSAVPGEAPGPGGRGVAFALAAILVVGAILRLWRLGGQSLWIDEIITLQAANVGGRLVLREALWNIQGPLHCALIQLISRVSTSEVAFRAPSALAGVATIPAVYLLGRDMLGRRVGLVAAAMAAVSPFAVWYSQEARNYSFVLFFSAFATWLAWRILVGRGRGWVAYVACLVLGFYSNLSAVFVALSHNVFALGRLFRDRRLLVRWVAAYAVIVLLAVPMYLGLSRWVDVDNVSERVVLAPLAEEQELLRGATTFSPAAVPYAVFTMIYGFSLGPTLTELHEVEPAAAFARHLWLVLPAGLAALICFALGFRALMRNREAASFVSLTIAVPILAAALLALTNVKPFNARYVAVLLPVLLPTMGLGVVSAGRLRGVFLGGLILLFCAVSLGHYYLDPAYGREDLRSVADYIEAHERSGDVVLVPAVRDVFGHYFEGEAADFVLYQGQTGSDEEVRDRVEAGLKGHERVWFIDSRLWHVDPAGRIPAYLEGRYRRIESSAFPGATVSLYALGDEGVGGGEGAGEVPGGAGGAEVTPEGS